MSLIARMRPLRLIALGLAVLPLMGLANAADAEPRDGWPSKVRAVYRVDFNGFDIGTFEFNADISGRNFTLTGNAQLSALLGAFKWRGATRSSGLIAANGPRPGGYTFDFAGPGKSGAIKMAFTGDSVSSLTHDPVAPPEAGTVPIKDHHLKQVLDPLSAIMALSRNTSDNPCDRRLAVFDGKQRFDLALSFSRQEPISETRPSGQPGVAFVCRVRYLPIAGHRMTDSTRNLSESSGIELSLRPVPSANLFIPHQITIPTGAGPATLTSLRVDIVTPRNEQIALSH